MVRASVESDRRLGTNPSAAFSMSAARIVADHGRPGPAVASSGTLLETGIQNWLSINADTATVMTWVESDSATSLAWAGWPVGLTEEITRNTLREGPAF